MALVSAFEAEGRRTIEVRLVGSGRRSARFRTSGPVDELAFSGRFVAALLTPENRRRRVEIFDARIGAPVRVASVSSSVRSISLSGRRLAYRAGRAVRLLDVVSGRNTLLALTGRGSAPSIEGNRVVWGVRSGRRYAVRAIVL